MNAIINRWIKWGTTVMLKDRPSELTNEQEETLVKDLHYIKAISETFCLLHVKTLIFFMSRKKGGD